MNTPALVMFLSQVYPEVKTLKKYNWIVETLLLGKKQIISYLITNLKTYPSTTGTADVWLAPESITKAVDFPLAKAAKTAFFTRKNAGAWYFSNSNSANFSLAGRVVHTASVNSAGWCSDGDLIT